MKHFLTFFVLVAGAALFAQAVEGSGLTVDTFITHVSANSYEYIGNEQKLGQYRNSYLQSRAILYPQVQGTLGGAWTDTMYDYSKNTELETKDQGVTAFAPKLSVSQLLPTSGTLSAEILDTLKYTDPGTINGYEADPFWANEISLSVNLAQPIYFKNAYKASKDLLFASDRRNSLDYGANKNALLIQALRDFYSLKQSLFSRQLIEKRLKADGETFKRVEKEHALGLWTRSVLVSARAALLKSETDYMRTDNAYKESMSSFSSIYNMKGTIAVTADIQELAMEASFLEGFEKRIEANNPSLLGSSESVRMLESQLILFEKDNAPTLGVGFGYSTTTPVENGENENRAVRGSLSVTARLADGGAYKNGRELKKSEIESAKISLTVVRERVLAQGRNTAFALELCEKNKEYYKALVESATYEYEKGIKDREFGEITDKELTELKLDFENARLAEQQNIIEKNTAYLTLLSLMGKDIAGIFTASR